jgi:uncharacterized protein YbaR (Trm112 family)
MIDKDLLEILACPATHQSLAEASPELLGQLGRAIAEGRQKNVAGQPVREPVEAALVRADRKLCYPIRDGIPVLLVDEGLPL